MKRTILLDIIVLVGLLAGAVTAGSNGNDECDGAMGLNVSAGSATTVMGSTSGATLDSGAPFCGTSVTAPGVWYSVTGTGNTMTASTCPEGGQGGGSADYDTKISVYCSDCPAPAPPDSDCCQSNGVPGCEDQACEQAVCAIDTFCCDVAWDAICASEALALCSAPGGACADGNAATCVTGNDDHPGCSQAFRSTASWCSQAGANYLILVHGFGAMTGNFTLEVSDNGTACEGAVECGGSEPNAPPMAEACDPGSVSRDGLEPCTPCEEGTAQPEAGQMECVPCEPGSFAGLEGATACEECASGTFQPDPGAAGCIPCEPGSFSEQGATSCNSPAPVVSWHGLGLSILLLLGVAFFGLWRPRSAA